MLEVLRVCDLEGNYFLNKHNRETFLVKKKKKNEKRSLRCLIFKITLKLNLVLVVSLVLESKVL